MKFSCSKDTLSDAVSTVQRAVSNNSTVPILSGILLETTDSGIKLTGYDLQTGIEAFIDADVTEKGSVVVLSKFFGDLVKKLPDEMVDIETDANFSLKVSCANSKFKINGLDSEPFPKIPVIDNADSKLVISQKILKDMINHTNFAVSKDAARRVLTGSNLTSDGHIMSLVSVDGFRMAVNRADMGQDFPVINYIVPGKTLSEIAKILSDEEDSEIVIYMSSQHLLFDMGDVRIISRLIDGDFINVDSIISKNPSSVVTCDCKSVLAACDRAALIIMNTEKSQSPVQLHSNGNDIVVSAQTENGIMDEPIEAEITGAAFDIDFNVKFLLDALKNVTSEKIKIEFSGSQGPCLIKPVEGEEFIYLILPVRR